MSGCGHFCALVWGRFLTGPCAGFQVSPSASISAEDIKYPCSLTRGEEKTAPTYEEMHPSNLERSVPTLMLGVYILQYILSSPQTSCKQNNISVRQH